MKAISLHQPWASMIASGKKTIETRTWPTSYRGNLLICSTKSPRLDGYPLGKALCIVKVVDCRPMERSDEKAACCQWYEGAYAWELADLRSISPVSVTGTQGFFEVDLVQDTKSEMPLFEGQP